MDTNDQTSHKKELIIGSVVIVGIIALVAAIAFAVYNGTPRIVYQPAEACKLLDTKEAKELLGAKAIQSGMKDPKLSGDTATSSCGYTDGNPDMDMVIVAAITVRSGVNDKGVQQNKTEFSASKATKGNDPVKDLGDDAYFNSKLGQLNILDGRKWIILSYGTGSAPETNTVDKATELAKAVLR